MNVFFLFSFLVCVCVAMPGKRQRAEEHQKFKAFPFDAAPRTTFISYCRCGKNQPGVRCVNQLCRLCCDGNLCPQHG